MYTEIFLNAQNKVTELETTFNNNPCRNTAKPLAAARVELTEVSYNNIKYTAEFRLAKKNQLISDLKECMINIINN